MNLGQNYCKFRKKLGHLKIYFVTLKINLEFSLKYAV